MRRKRCVGVKNDSRTSQRSQPTGSGKTDADLKFTYLSERHHEITGWPEHLALGQTREDLYHYRMKDDDCLRHREKLKARLPYEIKFESTRSDGETRVLQSCGKPIFDRNRVFKGYRGVGRDITEAHNLSEQLVYQASHDDLTGLVNRREFENRLQRVLKSSQTEETEHALCYIDVDQFKVVNDTCGHVAGDELLRQLGVLFQEKIRKRDTLARLGGDEFGVLMEHCSLAKARRVANALRQAVEHFRFMWDDNSF